LPALPGGCPDALFPEVEAPDPLPADARRQATAVWDASACARPDAAADAVHPEVRPQPADGAERWADLARDAQGRDAHCHRSAPRAALAAEPDAAELCTPAVVRFAERSFAAPEAAERPEESVQRNASQSEPPEERSLKLPEEEPAPLAAPDVPAARLRAAMLQKARPPGAPEQQKPMVTQPEAQLPASLPPG
jgi:hypothetical protein